VYTDKVQEFAAAVARGAFDAIFFTSAITARAIAPLLGTYPRVIAIGPQTAATLEHGGVHAEMLPSYYSRDLVPFLGTWIRGRRIGIPRADVPDDGLAQEIRNAGGEPVEIRCYALTPSHTPLPLAGADAVLFTSALSFRKAVWEFRAGLLLMAIGENTARAMQEGGYPPVVTGDGSLAGSLAALNRYVHGDTVDATERGDC
jgi:uroporphyrinogen-III synthase